MLSSGRSHERAARVGSPRRLSRGYRGAVWNAPYQHGRTRRRPHAPRWVLVPRPVGVSPLGVSRKQHAGPESGPCIDMWWVLQFGAGLGKKRLGRAGAPCEACSQ